MEHPFGRRIQKIWPNTANNSTRVRNYLYDGANIVTELNASGAVVASYTQGAGIDEPLAMRRGGYISYYHADGLGSITSLTNTNAQPVATYAYDSFGNTTATEGIFNPFRYTGREQDPETGLYYYRARYYDPTIGRFLSEDPVRYWGGIDFYKYVDNNPIVEADPEGTLPLGPTCLYYYYRCIQTAKQCRADLDKASGNRDENLCQANNTPNPDDAYFKVCFQGNYYCQQAIVSCGGDAVNPPLGPKLPPKPLPSLPEPE
ncbi:MAG: RHS repeat-associated core domain-containing protein [Candidatus Korobacteraceae bacterium]|jgi:RHS repeat-associated protein